METYTNEFHNKRTYIKIDNLEKVNLSDLEALAKDRPLQIGINSDQLDLIEFLKKAGFILKRKCYEVEATEKDLKKPLEPTKSKGKLTKKGEEAFEKAAALVFAYYKRTHESVSPLTVGLEQFKEILPEKAFYYEEKGQVLMTALLENDEIAYLAGFDYSVKDDFINDLLVYLFKNHQEIFFEADNTDPLATRLRGKFISEAEISYDTYVKAKLKK